MVYIVILGVCADVLIVRLAANLKVMGIRFGRTSVVRDALHDSSISDTSEQIVDLALARRSDHSLDLGR